MLHWIYNIFLHIKYLARLERLLAFYQMAYRYVLPQTMAHKPPRYFLHLSSHCAVLA